MKNIVITGASGQLGTEINKISNQYPKYNFIFADKKNLDISNFKNVKLFFNTNKVDFIINCAAYTEVDKAEKQTRLAHKVNSLGAKNLAILSQKKNSILVHISTHYVFDGKSSIPYTENDKTNPLSVYGRTKQKGEIQILNHTDKAIIVRTSWLYSSLFSSIYRKNFVKTILTLSKEKRELNIVSDQLGAPTYANDFARAILEIIERISCERICKLKKSQIYHYANEGAASWYDFAKAIVEIANIECRINAIQTKDYPVSAKRPHYGILNISKIKRDYGLTIPYWRDSLKVCLMSLKRDIQ